MSGPSHQLVAAVTAGFIQVLGQNGMGSRLSEMRVELRQTEAAMRHANAVADAYNERADRRAMLH